MTKNTTMTTDPIPSGAEQPTPDWILQAAKSWFFNDANSAEELAKHIARYEPKARFPADWHHKPHRRPCRDKTAKGSGELVERLIATLRVIENMTNAVTPPGATAPQSTVAAWKRTQQIHGAAKSALYFYDGFRQSSITHPSQPPASNAAHAPKEQPASAAGSEELIWQTGIPPVAEGAQRRFIVAIRGSGSGKIHRSMLLYSNQFIGPCSNGNEPAEGKEEANDDGDYYWTGWFEESCDQCDTFWKFSGDVVAWMPLPAYPSSAALLAPTAPASGEPGDDGRLHLTAELLRVIGHAVWLNRELITDPVSPIVATDIQFAIEALDKYGDQKEIARYTSFSDIRYDVKAAITAQRANGGKAQ